MNTTSLLIIGKHADRYINRNATLLYTYARDAAVDTRWIAYEALFSGTLDHDEQDTFLHDDLMVVLFFPHHFWDENCELPQDTGLYGTSARSYEFFQQYMFQVGQILTTKFPHKNISFLIDPARAAIDRDKIETIRILSQGGVPVTKSIASRGAGELLAFVAKGSGLFIKCRYGSEGKGITYISKEKWVTNYRVNGGRLANYGIHDRWMFVDITGRTELLEELLTTEVIIEEEIVTPEIEPGTKFDLRVYVLDGEVLHMFLRINQKVSIITNFSQGARVRHDYKKLLNQEQISLIGSTARSAASAMAARFIGVDCMFDNHWNIAVVETQVFTDFPDINHFDLARFLTRKIIGE